MQNKMLKPQLAQMATTFPLTLVIWYFILIPHPWEHKPRLSAWIWASSCALLISYFSFFATTLAQRILGITPIEKR
jgi:hypothetical protein